MAIAVKIESINDAKRGLEWVQQLLDTRDSLDESEKTEAGAITNRAKTRLREVIDFLAPLDDDDAKALMQLAQKLDERL